MNIDISSITADARLQHRLEPDTEYVDGMAGMLVENESLDLPDVTIFKDKDGILWLCDGFQRLQAYRIAKRAVVPAQVYEGDYRAAWLYSLGVNASHGRRRNSREITAILDKCFADEDISKRTNAAIANMICVSRETVIKYRKSLENITRAADALGLQPDVEKPPSRRTTEDDKERVRYTRQARRALGELITALEALGIFDELKNEFNAINVKANLI